MLSLLIGRDVPDTYDGAFDHVVRETRHAGIVSPTSASKTLAVAKLGANHQSRGAS